MILVEILTPECLAHEMKRLYTKARTQGFALSYIQSELDTICRVIY